MPDLDILQSPESVAGAAKIALPIILFVGLLAFVILGIVLAYHWKRYSAAPLMSWKFIMLYYIIGGALLFMMLGAYLTFTF